MRILQNRSVGGAEKSVEKNIFIAHVGGGFSLEARTGLSEAPASTGMAVACPLLVIFQACWRCKVRRLISAKEAAVRQGFETLDALDALKMDVLSGQVSRHKLLQLASMVENSKRALMNLAI